MHQIDVIIPTYKRADRLENLIKNFNRNSSQAELLFVIHIKDEDTRAELERLGANFITNNGEYVECINFAVAETDAPFIFAGADDILFTKDWDKKLLKVMKNKNVMVTGGVDDWEISKSGVHVSHPLIRRSYLGQSYWNATTNDLYYPGYTHYQCDIELEQLAHTRGVIKVCKDCFIHHNHFVNQKGNDDETYKRSRENIHKDTDNYLKRRDKFEYFDTEALHQGKAIPSSYRRKRLSIVMPIWNCKRYLRGTIESLIENTKNKYELIMIDDNSQEFEPRKTLEYFAFKCLKNGFTQVKVVLNKEQQFCNANWNKGVKLATGDYIAIINSDIEFDRQEWDEYLIKHVDKGIELVNPYERNHRIEKPYSVPPINSFLGDFNIRGCCFMLGKKTAKRIFPIPKELKHWFGDNWVARNAKSYVYERKVCIHHFLSRSQFTMDEKKFWTMVLNDCYEYKKLTNANVEPIIERCQNHLNSLKG